MFKRQKICAGLVIAITIVQMLSMLKIYDFRPLIALLGILLLLFTYNLMSTSFKRMTVIFIFLGACINIYTGQALFSWINGVNYMLNIAGILVIMQIFNIPIKLGNYTNILQRLILCNFKNERTIYIFATLVSQLFASFLLFGTIPVMVALMGPALSKTVVDYKRFASTAFTRSQAMVGIWSPGAVNMLLAVEATGSRWIDIFYLGIIMGTFGLILSYFIQLPYLSTKKLQGSFSNYCDTRQIAGIAFRKIAFIFLIVVVLIVMIMFFEHLNIGNNTLRVMLACLILSTLWLSMFVKVSGFGEAIGEYFNVDLVKTADLAVLYGALGFFSKALENSGIIPYFYPYLSIIAQSSGIFILPIISTIVFLLSFTGLHPFIIIVFLGKMLTSFHLPFSSAIITMALLVGAAASYTVSPFAGIVLTASKYLDAPVYEVGFKWNRTFAGCYFVLGSLMVMLLTNFFH